jgi:anti-anti-sigma regulatory factor
LGSGFATASFAIRAEQRNHVARLFLSGVLDAATRPALMDILGRLLGDSVRAVVLDMRALVSCDDDSAGMILDAHRRLGEAGRALFVLNADPVTGNRLEGARPLRLIDKDSAFRGLELALQGPGETWLPLADGIGRG